MKSGVLIFKKAASALCLIGIVVSIVFACPPVAEAATSDSERVMVSMGDSYSSGEGIEDFYDQDLPTSKKVQSYDWLAHRSENSWPGMLCLSNKIMKNNRYVAENSEIGISEQDGTWYFVASSGATTDNITGTQRKIYYKDLSFGYEYLPAQIDIFDTLESKGQKADYVTLTLGGNDADFSSVVKKVVMGSTYLNFSGLSGMMKDLWDKFYEEDTGIRDKLRAAYKTISERAGSQATILVAGYPKLLEQNGKGFFVSQEEAKTVDDNVHDFNEAIASLVKECQGNGMNIEFVSVEGAFSGHEAYSDDPYINEVLFLKQGEDLIDHPDVILENSTKNGIDISIAEVSIPSSYSIHPNQKGAEIYAKCVQDKIDELDGQNNRTPNEDRIPTTAEPETTAKVERPTTKPTTAQPTTYTSGDYEYQLLDDGTAEITSYTGSATELTIPLRLGGYEVTSIGGYVFWNCSSLTSITIPNSITSIGYNAFSYCSNLMSIAIPDSVTYISDCTFRFCSNLTSITIPDSVTGIGDNAFELCMNLKSITISNSVANIGDYAFACCYDLTNVSIPDSVKTIGEKAFGYNISEFGDSGKVDNFTIYGYSGTAAETYADENGFTFVELKTDLLSEANIKTAMT